MKIDRVKLDGFRGIQSIDISLDSQLTVLTGVNGAGKSSILDALAVLLSWVVARIRHSGGSGRPISEQDIHNMEIQAVIRIEASQPESLCWQLVKSRAGHSRTDVNTELRNLSDYAKAFQKKISESNEQCNIPMFAYYPVNRAVLDIPLRIRQSHTFGLLEAWDESLTSAANFRSFFKWFRNREDLENENRKYLDQLIKPDNWQFPDRQLEVVRKALEAFLPEFSSFSVRRNPLRMTVLKRNEEVRVEQLSDGEKCLIALVADLARRFSIANPLLGNPLEGEGIVLIDEIGMHLHPGWQRMVLPKLISTFVNCQFVVSTHSPQILGEIDANQIRILHQDDNNRIHLSVPQQSRGLSSNEILDEIMQPITSTRILSRRIDDAEKIESVFRLIDEERFTEAAREIDRLQDLFHGDTPDLVRAKTLLAMLEPETKE
jgi:predicted ATP-binding protein involved in virulence